MFHKGKVTPRNKTFVVAVDVDLTLFNNLRDWLNAFGVGDLEKYPLPKAAPDEALDLVHHIAFNSGKSTTEVLNWWKKPEIYDDVVLYGPMVETLRGIQTTAVRWDSDISFIVVSSCFPEHETAKWAAIERLMPDFFDAKISTSAKHHVDFDVIIDDSMGVVNNCLAARKKVLMVDSGLTNPSIGTKNSEYFLGLYKGITLKEIIEFIGL